MTETQYAKDDRMDVSLHALSHPYRRRILTRIHEHNSRDEAGFTIDTVMDDTDDVRVAIELHHLHLPKLAEAGFVEWDRHAKYVQRGPRFEEIAHLIDQKIIH